MAVQRYSRKTNYLWKNYQTPSSKVMITFWTNLLKKLWLMRVTWSIIAQMEEHSTVIALDTALILWNSSTFCAHLISALFATLTSNRICCQKKKGELVLLGKLEIKKISGTWEVLFTLPSPRFPHSYYPEIRGLIGSFFFPDTEMSTLRRSPTLQVSLTVYYRLMLNHLTAEQARRTHREWIKFTTLCVNRFERWSCRSVWVRCRE